MKQKRIPLRVVFLSVGLVFVATALVIQYLLTGQLLFSMPQGDEFQQSLAGIETTDRMNDGDDSSSSSLDPLSVTASEAILHSAIPPQGGNSPLIPDDSVYQVIKLVIPDLNIDAAVGRIGLVPWGEAGNQSDDQVFSLGSSADPYLQVDPHHETTTLDANSQSNVDIDAIRDMLGLDSSAQFTVYNLSNNYLSNAAQVESYTGQQQPIVILLDNARWILPEVGGSYQIATSWPDETGFDRFIIVAKPRDRTTPPENLN